MRLHSRSMRKLRKRMPGGRKKIAEARKRPSMPVCAVTREVLHGVPRARGTDMTRIQKSKRRPERPYGGMLSSKATRLLIIKKVRGEI